MNPMLHLHVCGNNNREPIGSQNFWVRTVYSSQARYSKPFSLINCTDLVQKIRIGSDHSERTWMINTLASFTIYQLLPLHKYNSITQHWSFQLTHCSPVSVISDFCSLMNEKVILISCLPCLRLCPICGILPPGDCFSSPL